ncbi:hypothetical protein ThidrDRAFT_2292 [Thiorhodococcus drewsii AZ1]|uniref:Uncharacterized protein n=1 Tax=Thiorhodococcus drewsii AZ1 TaxID=765913 RepID=G2E1X9_9GAMM|nr:hypothetical protein [Thiorhodococcus drewsii]EGV31187.1 hypothetical protein ThidrDRAFT_2292 [Thiorhodococcus drewsii AZ1]
MNNFQRDIVDFVKKQLTNQGVSNASPDFDQKVQAAVSALPGNKIVRLIAMRRALRAAGATSPHIGHQPQAAKAVRYNNEISQRDFIKKQVEYLADSFDYSTPVNGSIFWSGIDKNKLVGLVKSWNRSMGQQLFGQLECTTDAQYMDDAFDWNPRGAMGQYWAAVSEALGNGARGHVTSIQIYGLQQRKTNIFRHKELPAMLKRMNDQLEAGSTPDVTDITIVIAEPWSDPNLDSKPFTNQHIAEIPLLQDAENPQTWLKGRDPNLTQKVGEAREMIPPKVMKYWRNKNHVPISPVAGKLIADLENIKRR